MCSLRKKTPHSLTHTHARNHQHTTKKTPTKAGHAGYEIAPFVPSLAGAVAALSRFAAQQAMAVAEVDINPLLVLPEGQGAVALDALIIPLEQMP